MPKSKYPKALDTSVEIPPVRDNVLEVGSDVINSLRSAIFNIERVLGINPQGAVGNTVANRVGKSLDENGNIRAEALVKSNLLSGPILNSDVSAVASIQESKLKLDFPTTLLQDEISILNTSMEVLITKSESLSASLAAHTNTDAINRHPASSISVSSKTSIPGDSAIMGLGSGSVQSAFESIVDSHINYSGALIGPDNNSHSAGQVYFDNSNVTSVTSSSDLQNAMEDFASVSINSQISHQSLNHSNGILKVGTIDSASNFGVGNILAENISVSFSKTSGSSVGTSTITINDSVPLGSFQLEKSDVVTLSDPSDSSGLFVGNYEIESYTTSLGNLVEVVVFGTVKSDSSSLTVARISKNVRSPINKVSLLSAVREEASLTSASSIQICNPNSVKVISNGLRSMEITSSKRFIGVSIDSNAPDVIDLFDINASIQSIDSIVGRINEQCAENALNFLSYRVDLESGGAELAIALNLPDELGDEHTLTISRASDNGIDVSGFTYVEDVILHSEFGTNYYIDGVSHTGLNAKLDSLGLTFLATTLVISNSSSGLDFLNQNVKVGDLIVISGATNSSDNGSFVIADVSSSLITLGSGQLPSGFAGNSQDSTRFRIYSNIVSFNNMIFSKVSSTFGSVLSDIFMSASGEPFWDKRFEYSAEISGSNSLITLVDFEGKISDENFSLVASSGIDFITLSLDSGDSVEVRGDNNFAWVTSGAKNVRLKFSIPSVSSINSQISSSGSDISMSFYGFPGVNEYSNLLISRVTFDNFNGRVGGGVDSARISSIIQRGNIGLKELSTSLIKKYVEQPIDNMRTNGVIYGLEITNHTSTSNLFTFDISRGTCYVRGKRIEVPAQSAIVSDIDITSVDKVFIGITMDGEIRVSGAVPCCDSPLDIYENCLLATLEYDGVSISNIDMRLFISNIDLKLLNAITVSPQFGMGHFTDVRSAIKYAKRFSQAFPNAGVPTVKLKSGVHNVTTIFDYSSVTYSSWLSTLFTTMVPELYNGLISDGLVLDFPVKIIGEGDSSELNLISKYIFSDQTYNYRGQLPIFGNGFSSNSVPLDVFSSGFITLKDFRLNNSNISFVDLNITDGTSSFIFGIDIDNVTIDNRGFTSNPYDTFIGPKVLGIVEMDDTTNDKGNISVRNCKFIIDDTESNTSLINISSASRLKNVSFVNNRMMGANPANSIVLFSKDIWSFANANAGSNIELMGNIATSSLSSTSSSRSALVSGGSDWGDRVSRSLIVGGSVSGNSYGYNAPLGSERVIFMDQISDPAMGSASSNAASFSTETINFVEWKTILFSDAGVGTEFSRIRFKVLEGETLESIEIYTSSISSGSSLFSDYSLTLYSHDNFGVQTTEVASAVSSPTSSGNMAVISFPGGSISGQQGKHFWLKIVRNTSSGHDENLHYVVVRTNATSVESIGGLK